MLGDIIEFGNIVQSNLTITIDIKFLIGLLYPCDSAFIQIAPYANKELVEVDSTASVFVEVFEKSCALFFVKINSYDSHATFKFTNVNRFVSISINLLENLGKSTD